MRDLSSFAMPEQSTMTEQETVQSLLERIRQHDQEALLQLYRLYGGLVYSVAYRTLQDTHDSEEVTQDVFLRLWEKSEYFDTQRGSFIGWLVTITRNAAIDRFRRRQRQQPSTIVESLEDTPQAWQMVDPVHQEQDLRYKIAAAMHHLSQEQREAITLAYFEGLSHREIAEKLGRPLGTIKSHIRQGMQRLREVFESHRE